MKRVNGVWLSDACQTRFSVQAYIDGVSVVARNRTDAVDAVLAANAATGWRLGRWRMVETVNQYCDSCGERHRPPVNPDAGNKPVLAPTPYLMHFEEYRGKQIFVHYLGSFFAQFCLQDIGFDTLADCHKAIDLFIGSKP